MSSGFQSADDGERALALAVRRAVEDDDGPWPAERLSAVAERAAGRAARRRRRRLVVAPVAVVAAAAAVATGVVVLPSLVAAERAAPTAASRPPASDPSPSPHQVEFWPEAVSDADVRAVFPGASPPAAGQGFLLTGYQPGRDACGDRELEGVALPATTTTGVWQGVHPGDGAQAPPGASSTGVVRVETSTFSDAASASAATAALGASTSSCRPAAGSTQPTYPVVREVYLADAFFSTTRAGDAFQPPTYSVTAVHVTDRYAAAVTVEVTGTLTTVQREDVATRAAHLAGTAAARAADQTASGS